MKKVWSISTAVRNPERIRDFLKILLSLEGEIWNKKTQIRFQTLLIQYRLYGLSNQFRNNLSDKYIAILEGSSDITYEQAEEIIKVKQYTDFDMRGRQSFKPIEKLGFVNLDEDKRIKITENGKMFLKDNYKIDEIFFKSFLKWQLPNFCNDNYKECNIKPFVATLHLINEVNKLSDNPVGISREEFALFVPTLLNYKDIKQQAINIISFRNNKKNLKGKELKSFIENEKVKFLKNFFEIDDDIKIKKEIKNLKDYTDNIIRYFRITNYLFIRGNGYYIDLEPRRKIEIDLLLKNDNASIKQFNNKTEYLKYISDPLQPILPWQSKEYQEKIANNILIEIKELSKKYNIEIKIEKDNDVDYLREIRKKVQEKILHKKSQNIDEIIDCINNLKNIFNLEDKALSLEKYITIGLNALNDAIKIHPNYTVGDDNQPTNTASGNKPDIECFYNDFNLICEVTMLKDRSQWYNEGQPVMRHLRDFENKSNKNNNYCLFISPSIHRDTLNTFWYAVKYSYEESKQKIIPLTIKQFIEILDILLIFKKQNKNFTNKILLELYDKISDVNNINNSNDWFKNIENTFLQWKSEVI